MLNLDNYKSIPIGSLITVDQAIGDQYIEKLANLPKGLVQLALSTTTGAYLRGLAHLHNIDPSYVPKIAFAVLQTVMGDVPLVKLGSTLSGQLKIANDKAQIIAQDIEKELFTPIMLDFNESLKNRKSAPKQGTLGTQNVLNLKNSKPTLPPRF